ncbi:MAG: DNA repair protein RadC [Alphaproteobacteria bacterium]|nr:DNA repair protein RadC [Alphaproteobacteria bacterium]
MTAKPRKLSEARQDKITAESPHWLGHRQRLRERLFGNGPDSLQDYELLELLLGAAIPRRDVKPLAKELLNEFKDLWHIVHAPAQRLRDAGLGDSAIGIIAVAGAIALRGQKQQLVNKPLLNSWQSIVDYCQAAMAHENKEQLRLLFLDRRNNLLDDEVHQRGTIDHTPVYPREIVQRALELGAGAIVLVHNHPSGDPTPSQADIDMTRAVIAACKPLDITVHDHLIIGHGKVVSFKTLGIM